MTDVETGVEVSQDVGNLINLTDLDAFDGDSIEAKVDSFIANRSVVLFGKSWCPFCRDARDFLANQMQVKVYNIDIDKVKNGDALLKRVQEKTSHKTVPVVYIRGDFIGGCDDVKALHAKGELEKKLRGLVVREVTQGTDKLETAKLAPKSRLKALNPPFWFPNIVNDNVVRVTGMLVCILSVLSTVFHTELWGRYLAVGLLVDFTIRMTVGSFLSPLGMIATLITSPYDPVFKPGPPKQFAAFCGVMFSLLGTIFYFVNFDGHKIVGAIFMGMLAGASGLEGFVGFCLGCLFFGFGIQFGLIPDEVYRIYTTSREETVQSWNYRFKDSGAKPPEFVDTDPESAISLKYKKKTDEWTKDDFHFVKHMQAGYFGMPLGISGLAVAFKLASSFTGRLNRPRSIVVPEAYYQIFATIGAFIFVVFLAIYTVRLFRYPHKCWLEWDCPLRSNNFGLITINFMLYGFLIFDEIDSSGFGEKNPQGVGRIALWIGAVGHFFLVVAKGGEWIGRRLELEHVHPQWMILPVGLAVSSLVGSTIGWFSGSRGVENDISRFNLSFAVLMWIILFAVTFYKVVTQHNSDNRLRHGVSIWVAAPAVIALASYPLCVSDRDECRADFVHYFYMAMWLALVLAYAALPHLAFFGQEPFNMAYWTECFAIDTLAACAAFWYAIDGYPIQRTIMLVLLSAACIFNLSAFLNTLVCIVRKRGVFTPEVKWGPLSFMKLTHEAFRGNLETLKHYIDVADVEEDSTLARENLGLFAAHFNRFCTLHEEHAKHEDEVIFKTFNDYFPEHAKKWNDDHAEDHKKLEKWRSLANKLLDSSVDIASRKQALKELKDDLPSFFVHFEEHLRGEEDNLQPIGRKYLPLEVMKQISREVWRLTPAEKWEVILPFIVENLPHHQQRIRYVKVLCWSMPERAQQFGAIIYRNVDAVMWERLRVELPEIIPRGAPGYMRYY